MTETTTPQPAPPPRPDSSRRSSAALARSSALMASGTLVSRLLGLVRVALLTGALGVLEGNVGNAWSTANTLPNTIYILLAGGLLNSILVPQLSRAATRADGGRDFTDRLITLILLCIGVVAVLAVLAAPLLTKLYALPWEGEQLALAVAFAYLCLPQVFFYGLYSLLGQILNAHERFGAFMWAPAANNVVAIGGLVWFTAAYPDAGDLGPGEWTAPMVWLLAGTATLGVAVQALVLLVPLWRSGFRWRPRWGFRGVGLGTASRMAMWMFAVVGLSQAGMLLVTNVLNAATAEPGSGAAGKLAYENAFLLYILPHSLVAISLITAMFTRMSRAAAAEDLPALREQYRHGLGLLGVAMVPTSVAMILLLPAVTRVLFPLNSPEETRAIALVTTAMVIGLPLYGIYIFSGRVFHAFQDGRTPFRLQVVISSVTVVGVGAALAAPDTWAAVVLGLTQTVGQAAAAVLGLRWVSRRLQGAGLRPVATTYQRVVAAAIAASVPTLGVVLLGRWLLEGLTQAVVVLAVGGAVFLAGYAVTAHRLGVPELDEIVDPLLSRLRRRGAPPGAAGSRPQQAAALAWAAPEQGPGADRGEEQAMRGIEAGTVLGSRYELEELLAQREDVLDYWSAQDLTLHRTVAVTVLPSTGAHPPVAAAVLDGARRTAGVDDPRLVRVLDVGTDDAHAWVVEEGLLEAESLASLVTDGPIPAEEARRLVGEAASALESGRRRGLHHLYLTPHAVMRTREGTVKVSGVAVAAALEGTEELPAREASLIDTTDLVALLYTGLTGRWPGDDLEGLRPARRLADGALLAPSEVVPGVPGDLDALCRLTFAADYDPARGPQTPGELARTLAPWSSDVVTGAIPTPDAPLGGSGGAAAVLAGAGGAGAAVSAARPRERGADLTERIPRADAAGSADAAGPGTRPASARAAAPAAVGAGAAGMTGPAQEAGRGGAPAGAGHDIELRPLRQEPRHPMHPEEPSRLRGVVVLLLIVALVATGAYLAVGAIRDGVSDIAGGDEPARPLPTTTSEPTAPADDDEPTQPPPEEEPSEPRTEPYEIAGTLTYDSEGGTDEHNDWAPRAVDGDPSTAWSSYTYLAEDWGGLKEGVGFVVDLGESVPVSEVTVEFPEGDYGAEVFVGDEPRHTEAQSIGGEEEASDEWVVTAEEPVTGQYVIVWVDRAWDGPSGEIVHIAEITVR